MSICGLLERYEKTHEFFESVKAIIVFAFQLHKECKKDERLREDLTKAWTEACEFWSKAWSEAWSKAVSEAKAVLS